MNAQTLRKQNPLLAFIALCMGFFMVILDVTIVNVTLPTIANYFDASLSLLQWVVDGYTLMFAGLLLLIGTLTDRLGAKLIFQLGLAGFALSSLGCALSQSIHMLIMFRFLQGATGAFLLPSSLALIKQIYQDPKKQANAIGVWAAIGGVACASGPFLGGLLTSLFSWRAIFAVNILIGFTSLFLVFRYIKSTHCCTIKSKLNWLGQSVGFISIFMLAYGLIDAGRYGITSLAALITFGIGMIALIVFLFIERNIPFPAISLSIFRNKQTSLGLFVAMILNFVFYGSLFVFPFYFENIRHYNIWMTGLALLPLPGLAVFGSYLSGIFLRKYSAAVIMSVGMLLAAIGYAMLLTIYISAPGYYLIAIAFLIIGFGVSFTTPAMTFAAIQSAEESKNGIIAAVLNLVNQIGSLMGVALFGSIVTLSSKLLVGLYMVFIISSSLFLLTFILCLANINRRP